VTATRFKELDMRRIVVSEFVSLDGVMEDPGGAEGFRHGGWSFAFPDPDGMAYKLEEVMDHEAMLLGRVTYEGFAAAWPGRSDPQGFADKMNAMPKYVVSTTMQTAEWENSTVLGDLDAVAALRDSDGGDILVGGSRSLVQALLERDLVDELRLMVFPIVLGSGKRVFGDSEDAKVLKLAAHQVLGTGTVILTYARP
jgi:dihydrofolate reductase